MLICCFWSLINKVLCTVAKHLHFAHIRPKKRLRSLGQKSLCAGNPYEQEAIFVQSFPNWNFMNFNI